VRPRLGINLSGPVDWNTELPFVDVFRLARPWISQRRGAGWGKGPTLALDKHGWVTGLDLGCFAETPICTIDGGHYPTGDYTVLYDGQGKLEFRGAATIKASQPGRLLISVNPAKGGIFLQLIATASSDYVRNIRVIMPGFEKTYRENPWHPKFLERWQGVACLRFMDFLRTNNSTVSTWSERAKPDDATFATKGVPIELLVDLANRLKADPWFCIPHRADDDYVRNFAIMVEKGLAEGLTPYIEYSNEVWNSMFQQHAYAAEQGKKLGFAEKPWEAAWRYTAHRSVQIFRIWEEVFGGSKRLVRVLASQAANAYVSKQILSFHDACKQADVLAIAPYLSMNVGPKSKPSAEEVAGWSVDQVLDFLEKQSLPQSTRWIRDNKTIANQFGVRLVAYEGGQHMVGVQGAENNTAVTRLLLAANADPRLAAIYRDYLNAWQKEGGDLFCHFSSVDKWSKWGSWGCLQYYDEDPAKAPKFSAIVRWAEAQGQHIGVTSR
jgi:hypothetical protein